MLLQEAEEAAAAEVLKLQQELGMEEAGLRPHPEEDDDNQDLKEVPDQAQVSDQQSYQLYVQALKPGSEANEDANLNQGADAADNNTLLSDNEDMDEVHSNASDDPLRRRRVSTWTA